MATGHQQRQNPTVGAASRDMVHHEIQNFQPAPQNTSTMSALEATALSLERSLVVLSEHLNRHTNGSIIDPPSIGETADAISKTSQALSQVKQLLWSESRALLG